MTPISWPASKKSFGLPDDRRGTSAPRSSPDYGSIRPFEERPRLLGNRSTPFIVGYAPGALRLSYEDHRTLTLTPCQELLA